MFRSLRSRLLLTLALLIAAAIASGYIMFSLFEQSATAQVGQAGALAGRACDAIGRAYRFYTLEWKSGPPDLAEPAVRRDLTAVVFTALRDRQGIEGGLWQAKAGAIAYAFPTYEGSGPKTDVPQAEEARIAATSQRAQSEDKPQLGRTDAGAQTLLIAACPLPGPIPDLAAWTMTRVHSLAGPTYWRLMSGLAILALSVGLASLMAGALIVTWSRRVAEIVKALAAAGSGELPRLEATGERELDFIVTALNDARGRLIESTRQTEALTQKVAASERLAAVGRVTAGVAHEFRNPLAAMRLRAEGASRGDPARKDQALSIIIAQIDRLDGIIRRLLTATERDPLHRERVTLAPFLAGCVAPHRDLAAAKGATLSVRCDAEYGVFDKSQMSRAVGNLVANALQEEAPGEVVIAAARSEDKLILSVSNRGAGPPEGLRGHLFDPFVSGSPDRAGLGLAIVREIAGAHEGTADFLQDNDTTVFRIVLPCPES